MVRNSRFEVQNVRGPTLLRHERHATNRRKTPRFLNRIERRISSTHIPCSNQSHATCTVMPLGMPKAAGVSRLIRCRLARGCCRATSSERPCFALAGGGVIETGACLNEFFLACGVADEEVQFVCARRMHVAHHSIE
jgi:hypothetical protein